MRKSQDLGLCSPSFPWVHSYHRPYNPLVEILLWSGKPAGVCLGHVQLLPILLNEAAQPQLRFVHKKQNWIRVQRQKKPQIWAGRMESSPLKSLPALLLRLTPSSPFSLGMLSSPSSPPALPQPRKAQDRDIQAGWGWQGQPQCWFHLPPAITVGNTSTVSTAAFPDGGRSQLKKQDVRKHMGRWLCKVLSPKSPKEAMKKHHLPEAVLLQQP